MDLKRGPGDRGNHVNDEHAAKVAVCDFLPVTDLFALNAEVSRAELKRDVEQEENID